MRPSQLGAGSTATDKSSEFTAEFLAAIFTWGGIGWLLDRLLDTSPVLMCIGFVVGNACGIYLLYIRSRAGEVRGGTTPASEGAPRPQTTSTSPTDSASR
ncbi:AtpZ/AtpI family protein [Euzebya sp.]|uniref:AtpZ/AtpI family protein n=1 Tax=Euzebya sp. TaxID=1971409 RepID=UPI0035145B0D